MRSVRVSKSSSSKSFWLTRLPLTKSAQLLSRSRPIRSNILSNVASPRSSSRRFSCRTRMKLWTSILRRAESLMCQMGALAARDLCMRFRHASQPHPLFLKQRPKNMVLKDFGVKTQGHRCEAKRFRFVTFWGMWLVFSTSSIASGDKLDTVVTKWENTVQPWLKQTGDRTWGPVAIIQPMDARE